MRLEVCLTLIPTEEGGRERPLEGRFLICWIGAMAGSHKTYNDARLHLIDQDMIAPGETVRACLEPLVPELWSHVEVGTEIEIHGGFPWLIGRAVVVAKTAK